MPIRVRSAAVASAIALVLLLPLATPVAASAPDNDNLANATIIAGMPFEAYPDLSEATTEPGEQFPCSGYNEGYVTVWYSYTPSVDGAISVGLGRDEGTAYGTVYGPDDPTGIVPAATGGGRCFDSSQGPIDGALRMAVTGDSTYLFQIYVSTWYGGSEPVHLVMEAGPPPLSVVGVVATAGTVQHASGVAWVSITVTCNNPANFWIYATLRERLTRTKLANAFADNGGQCGPQPSVITLGFADDDVAFAPGSAQLSGHIDAADGWTFASLDASATVKLRHQR